MASQCALSGKLDDGNVCAFAPRQGAVMMDSSSSSGECGAAYAARAPAGGVGEDVSGELAGLAPAVVRPRRGRPTGSSGSAILRQARQNVQQRENEQQQMALPQPGDIAYARQCRQQMRGSNSSSDRNLGNESCGGILTVMSPVWAAIQTLGTLLQQVVMTAATWSLTKQGDEKRSRSEHCRLFDFKQAAVMSDQALGLSMKRGRRHLPEKVSQAAAAAMLSGGVFWAGLLSCIRANASWKKELCIVKMRYDETPLKQRAEIAMSGPLQDKPIFLEDTAEHCKIMQLELSVHCLVQETSSGRRLLLSGLVPTTLQCVQRTTAECIKRAILNTTATVPELAALTCEFSHKLRVAVLSLSFAFFCGSE